MTGVSRFQPGGAQNNAKSKGVARERSVRAYITVHGAFIGSNNKKQDGSIPKHPSLTRNVGTTTFSPQVVEFIRWEGSLTEDEKRSKLYGVHIAF